MRWNASRNLNRRQHFSVSFERVGSNLRMNDDILFTFSIVRSPQLETPIPIQIGIPKLPDARSNSHFETIRQWLANCDQNHQTFKCKPLDTSFVPTRLIDVGIQEGGPVRLCDMENSSSVKYVALSHPWGKKAPYFRTFRKNVKEYKIRINMTDLTKTFQDAVVVTRELGFRYLWIDSICIIQRDEDDPGDFESEAKRMEKVFSSAYCVIAASSAEGQSDGFLNDRTGSHRDVVAFAHSGQHPYYVCSHIDDFNSHVLESHLSKRGWVMQERALAHRTIYFTSHQTYWECGQGVRCETLTFMDNKLASFLGDPNFPEKITSKFTSRGERIMFYQNLFKQYSRLAFTRWEDRPIAIAGLEKRLIYDLNTHGGFGVFDDGQSFLRRSLLWRRGKDQPTLRKIAFPPERHISVPSWSWMAYEGGIDFLDLPLGGVDWKKDEVHSPWLPNSSEAYHTADRNGSIELKAVVRDFDPSKATMSEVLICYDVIGTGGQPLKCIVMGSRKDIGLEADARHYVLLVGRRPSSVVYERIGVGFMPGRCIDLSILLPSSSVKIR